MANTYKVEKTPYYYLVKSVDGNGKEVVMARCDYKTAADYIAAALAAYNPEPVSAHLDLW